VARAVVAVVVVVAAAVVVAATAAVEAVVGAANFRANKMLSGGALSVTARRIF